MLVRVMSNPHLCGVPNKVKFFLKIILDPLFDLGGPNKVKFFRPKNC